MHPDIEEAVCFAVPDEFWGEAIGCALCLKSGMNISEKSIHTYLNGKLSEYKVPKYVLFLDELPKSCIGKLQRIGMWTRLGIQVKK